MNGKSSWMLSLGAAVIVALPVVIASSGGGTSGPATAEHDTVGGPATGQLRTVVIYQSVEPEPSAPGSVMRAELVHGGLAPSGTTATVLTDDDCAPDAAGVSRCLNRLRLHNGRVLTVRHPHSMASIPCMTPGERVRTRGA